MSYVPNVNDYVTWKKGIEGWVYFKDADYITIEAHTHPKDSINFKASPIHANNRLLILCYLEQWSELTYVKKRNSVYDV